MVSALSGKNSRIVRACVRYSDLQNDIGGSNLNIYTLLTYGISQKEQIKQILNLAINTTKKVTADVKEARECLRSYSRSV